MIKFSFSIFVQLQPSMTNFFKFSNKVNLCAAVISLFLLILYSLLFYVIVSKYEKKKYAKNLLITSKYTTKSFILESFCRVTRNLIRGFFHGFFISNYKLQIIGLMWSNLLYLIMALTLRKVYETFLIFILQTLYYSIFFIFDLVLTVIYFTKAHVNPFGTKNFII